MFFALLFMLTVTFLIGWKVGTSVQDEVVPARRYLQYGAMLAIAVMTFIASQQLPVLWRILLCVACAALLFVPFLPAVIAGVVFGMTVQADVVVLCLLANYLLGAIATRKDLVKLCLLFACASIIAQIAI